VEGSIHAKNQLDSCSHFNTIPAFDRQTDGRAHDDSKYHAIGIDIGGYTLQWAFMGLRSADANA